MAPFRWRPWTNRYRYRWRPLRRRFGRAPRFRRGYRRQPRYTGRRRRQGGRRRRTQTIYHWNPPKVRDCIVSGFAPLLICDQRYYLEQYSFRPERVEDKPVFKGGCYGRFNITLQTLWDWHKADWNVFSTPTTSYNLCRFLNATLKFFRHPNINYMVIIQQDYCDNTRAWPFFHPAKILFQKHHYLVLSRQQAGHRKNYVTVRLKPKPTDTNAWHLMAQMAEHAQFTVMVVCVDTENPFQHSTAAQLEIRCLNVPWGTFASNKVIEWRYHWIWDTGKQNCFLITNSTDDTPPQGKGYADGNFKETPYWLSLFGLTRSELSKTWIWIPDESIYNIGVRNWGKLKVSDYNNIVVSAPFFLKTLQRHFSLNMLYKIKFQFGGPDIDEGYDAGLNPSTVPPGCKPNENNLSGRVEVSNIASRARALANMWEFRRGLLTTRAFERLTRHVSPSERSGRSSQEKRERWPSEEEITSAEEDSSETTNSVSPAPQKKKTRRHRYRYTI